MKTIEAVIERLKVFIYSAPIKTYNGLFDDLNMAIKALEKQIPKKPIFVDTRFRHHGKSISDGCSIDKCYKCPGCNTHIFHVWDDDIYCERCGQALDWGE